MPSYARKRDRGEVEIVSALESAGWVVYRDLPTDLLCFKGGIWKTLEVKVPNRKDGSYRPRTDQEKQNRFCELTGTPRVCSPEEALQALDSISGGQP